MYFFFQFLFSFDGEKITIILKDEWWAKNYSSSFHVVHPTADLSCQGHFDPALKLY